MYIDYKKVEKEKFEKVKKKNKLNKKAEKIRKIVGKKGEGVFCYQTFEVTENFKKIETWEELESVINKENIKLFFNTLFYWREYFNPVEEYKLNSNEELEKISLYYNKNLGLLVSWFWDGDGNLLFSYKENDNVVMLENRDCKKDYSWEEL